MTSSMLRRDSVITPDRRKVSRLMERWTVLIFFESSPVRKPSTPMPMRKTGISSQLFVMLYQTRKPMPMIEENSTLIREFTNRSVSVFTFCMTETVSPLRLSSNSWKESRRVCFRPSLTTFIPKRATAMRARYSCSARNSLASTAMAKARASQKSTPCTSSFSGRLPRPEGEVVDDLSENDGVDQAEQLRQQRRQQGDDDQPFMGFQVFPEDAHAGCLVI